MKKTFRTILLFALAILMLFTSCNDNLQKLEEGSVNEYIYPYIRFEKSDDGASATAIVIAGAKLNTVKIPASLDGIKVNTFIGFENPEDAKSVKEIVIGSNDTVITDEALKDAINLEQVKVDKTSETQFWGKLPILEREGYEFLGWFAGDTLVVEGMPIDPAFREAVPRWREHVFIEHPGKEPTCTEFGWKPYKTCAGCGYSDYEEIPALGHDLVLHEKVDATCTTDGNRSYYECTRCHEKFADKEGKFHIEDVVIKATGHKLIYKKEVKATCQSVGYKPFYVCSVCGEKFEDDEGRVPVTGSLVIDKLEHTFDTKWSYDDEYHWHLCMMCHQEKSDYGKHNPDRKIITKAPGPDEIGEYVMECECGYRTDPIPMTEEDHDIAILERVEPTCTEDGHITYYCKDPGCEFIYSTVIEKLNHRNAYEVEAKEENCTEDGNIYHWHCPDCGLNFADNTFTEEIENVAIDKLGHDFSGEFIDDRNGKHYQVCSRCGVESEHVPHSVKNENILENDANLYHAANCTEPASYYKTCICGFFDDTDHSEANLFSVGEKLGHLLVEVPAVDKTCTTSGNIRYWKCSRENCDACFADAEGLVPIEISETVIPASHTYEGKAYEVNEDSHRPICDVCGEPGPWQMHDSSKIVHDAEGHWLVCSVCGKKMSEKQPHEWKIAPNDDRYCPVCGLVQGKSTEGGGFDVDEDVRIPSGTLRIAHDGNVWTFSFVNGNPGYYPTSIRWFVNDSEQEVTGESFVLHANKPRSYTVMCVYMNEYGVGSTSMTVTGSND